MSIQTSGDSNCSNNMNNKSEESKSGSRIERKVEKVENSTQNSIQKSGLVRKGPKNWDKIVKELEEEEKDDNSAEDVLRHLYANSDDECKRAMNKSFAESKGTTLSMDWKSVGEKYVKPYEEQNSDDSDHETN